MGVLFSFLPIYYSIFSVVYQNQNLDCLRLKKLNKCVIFDVNEYTCSFIKFKVKIFLPKLEFIWFFCDLEFYFMR